MKKLILLSILLIVGCEETTGPKDCADVVEGTAGLDSCAVCVGGTTNLTACAQDCAGIWGGDAVSKLVGDIDGDGYITGCCDQPSCQNNPVIENNNPEIENNDCGDKPLGDVSLFAFIYLNELCSWWSDSTTNISDDYWHSTDVCDNYYWNDSTADGIIDIIDISTFSSHFIIYPDSTFPIVNNPNTCFGKHLGDECCISN